MICTVEKERLEWMIGLREKSIEVQRARIAELNGHIANTLLAIKADKQALEAIDKAEKKKPKKYKAGS